MRVTDQSFWDSCGRCFWIIVTIHTVYTIWRLVDWTIWEVYCDGLLLEIVLKGSIGEKLWHIKNKNICMKLVPVIAQNCQQNSIEWYKCEKNKLFILKIVIVLFTSANNCLVRLNNVCVASKPACVQTRGGDSFSLCHDCGHLRKN